MGTAENKVIRYVQEQSLPEVFKKGKQEKRPQHKQASAVEKLNPILVDGLLQLGGRLSKAPIQDIQKHPVILLSDHPVTKPLDIHNHEKVGHCGMDMTWTSLRDKYWKIKGGANVRHVIGKCFLCKREKRIQRVSSCKERFTRREDYSWRTTIHQDKN